jgi:hypothetical protein
VPIASVVFAVIHLILAALFFQIAKNRPQSAAIANLYAACCVLFACSKLAPSVALGLSGSDDLGAKWFQTFALWTDVLFLTIAALPYLSRDSLIVNGIATSIGVVAIVAVKDQYVQSICDFIDLAAIPMLTFAIMAHDAGRNPAATRALFAASFIYGVPQVLYEKFKTSELFLFGLAASAVAFSIMVLVVLDRSQANTPIVPDDTNLAMA